MGSFVTLGKSSISWKMKKQIMVSRSFFEGEYRAMAIATGELAWLLVLLKSMGVIYDSPMIFVCNCQAAIHVASNPYFINLQSS